jgi:hypothetical protein
MNLRTGRVGAAKGIQCGRGTFLVNKHEHRLSRPEVREQTGDCVVVDAG